MQEIMEIYFDQQFEIIDQAIKERDTDTCIVDYGMYTFEQFEEYLDNVYDKWDYVDCLIPNKNSNLINVHLDMDAIYRDLQASYYQLKSLAHK